MGKGYRIACWVMAALFLSCAALQYNDPDPIRWMAIYGAGMTLSLLLPSQRRAAWPALVVGVACAVWAAYLINRIWGVVTFTDIVGKMSEKGGAVEEEREAGGLVIQGAWLIIAGALRLRRSTASV